MAVSSDPTPGNASTAVMGFRFMVVPSSCLTPRFVDPDPTTTAGRSAGVSLGPNVPAPPYSSTCASTSKPAGDVESSTPSPVLTQR